MNLPKTIEEQIDKALIAVLRNMHSEEQWSDDDLLKVIKISGDDKIIKDLIREEKIKELDHIDAEGDDASYPFYWWNDDEDKYHTISIPDRIKELKENK